MIKIEDSLSNRAGLGRMPLCWDALDSGRTRGESPQTRTATCTRTPGGFKSLRTRIEYHCPPYAGQRGSRSFQSDRDAFLVPPRPCQRLVFRNSLPGGSYLPLSKPDQDPDHHGLGESE